MVGTPDLSTRPPEIDAEKKLSIVKIVSYLDERLPEFPAFFKKKTLTKNVRAEKKISRELCLFLNNVGAESVSLFHFYPEWDYENSHRSSDLAVIDVKTYANSPDPAETFFVIEAKRLPTPGKNREKEYVEGNLGGIQRYKMGHHGAGLGDSAIIGYIQDKNDFDYWSKQINIWITDLVKTNAATNILWDADDLLTFVQAFISLKRYVSRNSRKIDAVVDTINLNHYLINLN